jgi:hypothetical protein
MNDLPPPPPAVTSASEPTLQGSGPDGANMQGPSNEDTQRGDQHATPSPDLPTHLVRLRRSSWCMGLNSEDARGVPAMRSSCGWSRPDREVVKTGQRVVKMGQSRREGGTTRTIALATHLQSWS